MKSQDPNYSVNARLQDNVAAHFSAGKPGMQWLPWGPLQEVAKVLDYGAHKYGSRSNWRKGMKWMELAGSTVRHVSSWIKGDDFDAESGLHHLAHAVCDLLFLLEYHLNKVGEDDRK